jgi:hypothetical protein
LNKKIELGLVLHQEINQIKNPSSNEVVEEDKVIEIKVKPKVKNARIVKPKKKRNC